MADVVADVVADIESNFDMDGNNFDVDAVKNPNAPGLKLDLDKSSEGLSTGSCFAGPFFHTMLSYRVATEGDGGNAFVMQLYKVSHVPLSHSFFLSLSLSLSAEATPLAKRSVVNRCPSLQPWSLSPQTQKAPVVCFPQALLAARQQELHTVSKERAFCLPIGLEGEWPKWARLPAEEYREGAIKVFQTVPTYHEHTHNGRLATKKP